jgi:hypothetical protein
MGHSQHTASSSPPASGPRRLERRVCLRKGCGSVFQPTRWSQRYCGDPECRQLVRRWQAAKRQRRHRESEENRRRHAQAQRERRRRHREAASATENGDSTGTESESCQSSPGDGSAWSRGKELPEIFCDRVGCYEPLRDSSRAPARYCGDDCRQAVRRVLDRERKWLRRNTYAGRFKRQLEYERARCRRGIQEGAPRAVAAKETTSHGRSVGNYSACSDRQLSYRTCQEHPP